MPHAPLLSSQSPVLAALLALQLPWGGLAARANVESFSSKTATEIAGQASSLERDAGAQRNEACTEAIPGATWRSWSSFKVNQCECPHAWVVAGEEPECAPLLGQPYFPPFLAPAACRCEYPGPGPKDYIDMDHLSPHLDCGTEYRVPNLMQSFPDLAASAHGWCDSARVPQRLRVPQSLRGLWWMHNAGDGSVALCLSLAEWDSKTLTARLAPWTHFAWLKVPGEEVPAGVSIAAKSKLVYSFKFNDTAYSHADITANSKVSGSLASTSLKELSETPDGKAKREDNHDIFLVSASNGGTQGNQQYAARIMYGDGAVHRGRYQLLKDQEVPEGASLMRFGPRCAGAP